MLRRFVSFLASYRIFFLALASTLCLPIGAGLLWWQAHSGLLTVFAVLLVFCWWLAMGAIQRDSIRQLRRECYYRQLESDMMGRLRVEPVMYEQAAERAEGRATRESFLQEASPAQRKAA